MYEKEDRGKSEHWTAREGVTRNKEMTEELNRDESAWVHQEEVTPDNSVRIFEEVTSKLDKGESVDVIYLEFQKTFDKEPHRRLLNKIRAHVA
eukprot:g36008.t1